MPPPLLNGVIESVHEPLTLQQLISIIAVRKMDRLSKYEIRNGMIKGKEWGVGVWLKYVP